MKIGFVLDDTLDSTDGVQQYVLTLGDWLVRNGHHVHYLVGESTRKDVANVHSLTKNIKVKFNKNRMSVPLPANKTKIKNLLGALDLDVIHVQMPYSPHMAARVINSAKPNAAVIATFHILPFSKKEILATKLLAKSVRKSSRRIDQVVSVSKPAAQFVKDSFGLESIIIPNPVAFPNKKQTKNKSDDFKIVYLGRLVARKGSLELLKAFKILTDRRPDLRLQLDIGGGGHLKSKIEDFIKQNRLSDKVNVLGFVPEDEKSKLLSSADLAVFPSLGGESFGIVLTEAMSSGAGVVIGGDNPGYRSVLEDDAFLFDAHLIDTFADKLEVLIDNPKLRSKLHDKQQQQVMQYDIEKVGPKICNVYQRMIAKASQ